MKKIILIFFILCSIYGTTLMGSAGSTGAQFLRIPPDSRGNSLAGSLISDVEGLNSLYWNPAGLNYIEKKNIMLSYNKWISDINYFYLAYGMPVSFLLTPDDSIGIGLTYMDGGDLESTDMQGNKGATLSSYYAGITAGYSTKIKQLDLGTSIKIFKQSLFDQTSMLFGMDIGGKMKIKWIENLSGGIVLKNIGIAGAFEKESDVMPFTIQAGLSYGFIGHLHIVKTMLSSDFMLDESPFINLGIEYSFKEIIFGRIGYKIETGKNNLAWIKGMNSGIGAKYKNLSLDISWGSLGVLGNLIQSTIGISF